METVELAEELIGFETVSPVKDAEVFEFLKMYLGDRGINATIRDINGVKSLTASTGSGEKSVCLNGHIDVVEPGSGWTKTRPFQPIIEDGKLYGRGASDMKAALAAQINAFIDLHKDPEFDGKAALMVVGDEEQGGLNGTKQLVDDLYSNGQSFDYVLVGEPTDMDLQVGTRGAAWFNVYLHGREAHSSKKGAGDNTISKLPEAIESLENFGFSFDKQGALPDPTLEVTVIETDKTYNVKPGEAKIGLDVRYLPSQDVEEIKHQIEQVMQGTGLDYTVELDIDHGGAFELTDERFRKVSTDAVAGVNGHSPRHVTEGGTSDGRFFAQKGCPFIELGLNRSTSHQPDEYCKVDNLPKLRKSYYRICKKIIAADSSPIEGQVQGEDLKTA